MVAWKHKNQYSITKWPEYSARAINQRISLWGLSDNSLPRTDLKTFPWIKILTAATIHYFPWDYKTNTITIQNDLHIGLLFLQISGYQIRAASTSFYLRLSSTGRKARSSVWTCHRTPTGGFKLSPQSELSKSLPQYNDETKTEGVKGVVTPLWTVGRSVFRRHQHYFCAISKKTGHCDHVLNPPTPTIPLQVTFLASNDLWRLVEVWNFILSNINTDTQKEWRHTWRKWEIYHSTSYRQRRYIN